MDLDLIQSRQVNPIKKSPPVYTHLHVYSTFVRPNVIKTKNAFRYVFMSRVLGLGKKSQKFDVQ